MISKRRLAHIAISLSVLILSIFRLSHAQTMQAFEEFGVGPRDVGMGNAYAAVADDFASAFYNPAGVSQTENLHVTFGYKFLAPEVNAKLSHYGKDRFTKYPWTQWGLFGFTTDFNAPKIINPKYTDPISFALAIAISDFIHSYTNYYDQHTAYYFRYQDRPVALFSAYFGFAYEIASWVSVGVGFVLAPSITHVDARVRTDVYLPEGRFDAKQGTVNRAYSVMDPTAGLLFRIPIADMDDRLRVGVSWRDEVKVVDGNGHALNRLIIHPPNTDQTMEPVAPQSVPVKTLSGFSPMQVTLGLSAKPAKGTLISADTIWKDWSQWQNYFYNRPDPPFKDTFQERMGFEQKIFTEAAWLSFVALRAGWYYEPSPVPSMNGKWNILDNHKHVTSAGFGLSFDRLFGVIKTPVTLDFGFQSHWLLPRVIENDHDVFPKIETDGAVHSGSAAVEFTW